MIALEFHQTLSMIQKAVKARSGLFEADHQNAFRLFNGFSEGCPDLVLDLYATSLLVHNYSQAPETPEPWLPSLQSALLSLLPWVKTVIVKTRNADDPQERRGKITFGGPPDQKVRERGVWYAIDLLLNRDASLYLDTRNLRSWILDHLHGKTVLNLFAYSGSLGVAALAAGAQRVIQLDRSQTFLNLAAASYALNGFQTGISDLLAGDFFSQTRRMRRAGLSFDCVLVDPPYFSVSSKGRVDLVGGNPRLINKVRPLVSQDGWLVLVNNALFVSGKDYLSTLQDLCADGYLEIEEIIPVPSDFTGYAETIKSHPSVDPAPFNYSTKIAVLRVKKKIFHRKTA
jgi:23S rRNA (cytosine1962-C5)-methyltransferase